MRDEEPVLSFKAQLRYGAYGYTDIIQLSDRLPFVFRNKQRTQLVNLRIWLQNRVIQNNREFIENIRNSLGNLQTFELLVNCYGVSLNDVFWIKSIDSTATYADINFYTNKFDEGLSCITLTGKSEHQPTTLLSPECTTGGALAKCWGHTLDGITLFKRNTLSSFIPHREVLSEVLVSFLAKCLEINVVSYSCGILYEKVCCACKLFTSKEHGLLTISEYLSSLPNREIHELNDLLDLLVPVLTDDMITQLTTQFVLDWLVENEDRHFNNWGFLIDNATNQIISTAPIYDNGRSLFWNKSIHELENLGSKRYVSSKTMIDGMSNELLLRQWLLRFPNEVGNAQRLIDKANNLTFSNTFKEELKDIIYNYFEVYDTIEKVDFSEVSYFSESLIQHIFIQLEVEL